MGKALSKQVDTMIDRAIEQGFSVKEKKSGVMVMGTDGGMVMLHRTPSDTRGVKNAASRLRKIGVAV
jgi:hypothetical protein